MPHQARAGQDGFSLIELMISVSIVSILATIALPNFGLMIAKTRQKEAFAMLGGVYIAEQAVMAETGHYSQCLYNIGYEPSSPVRYYTISMTSPSSPAWAYQYGPSGATCDVTTLKPYPGGGFRTDGAYVNTRSAFPALVNNFVIGGSATPDLATGKMKFFAQATGYIDPGATLSWLPQIPDIMIIDESGRVQVWSNGL